MWKWSGEKQKLQLKDEMLKILQQESVKEV
ncbi:hypothetical protein DJICPGNB_05275 [Escherichia coli]|nr:hypothetical protein DJICPGNB_05275 [Escherichia coli]